MFYLMLLELFKKSYRIYKPYFSLTGNGRYHTILSLLILAGNISLAFFMSLINAAFDTLMGSIVPGVSYRDFFSSTGYFLLAVLAYAGVVSINNWLASKLSASVAHDYNEHIRVRWKKAYVAMPSTAQYEDISPAQIISNDSPEVTSNISYLVDNFLMTTSNFIIGLMGLIVLSGPLIFPFMGWSIYIPDYLAIATVVYSLGFNVISEWAGNKLRDQQAQQKSIRDTLYHHLHHLKTHAESIAFLKSMLTEASRLKKTMLEHRLADVLLGQIKSKLAFLNSLHQQMASIFGVIISAPNIIEGHMDTTGVFQVSHHFSDVVRWFTWRNENLDKISETLVGLERLEAFEEVLDTCDALQTNNPNNKIKFKYVPYGSAVTFKNIELYTKDGKKIVGPLNISFANSEYTHFDGDSGSGKTTVLRALAHLWFFGSGTIYIPLNKDGSKPIEMFLPQKPYFLYQETLIKIITGKDRISEDEMSTIVGWMEKVELDPEVIRLFRSYEVREWEKILSGGQKQMMAIFSVFFKKPDIIYLDECTSAIDKDRKNILENMFRSELPKDTTLVFTDHNPSNHFHDHTVKIEKSTEVVFTPLHSAVTTTPKEYLPEPVQFDPIPGSNQSPYEQRVSMK